MTLPSLLPGMAQHMAWVDAQYTQLFAAVRTITPYATAQLPFIEPFQFLIVGGASLVQRPPPPSYDNPTRADGDDDDGDIANIAS